MLSKLCAVCVYKYKCAPSRPHSVAAKVRMQTGHKIIIACPLSLWSLMRRQARIVSISAKDRVARRHLNWRILKFSLMPHAHVRNAPTRILRCSVHISNCRLHFEEPQFAEYHIYCTVLILQTLHFTKQNI
jgi:hypothetical protein